MAFFVLAAITDHFTVVGLVSLPLNECEVEVDLVLTQTSFVLFSKLQGLYQNNVNSRTIFITVKWA